MLSAIAIDDEPLPLELMESFCKKNESLHFKGTFSKISEAKNFLKTNDVDLLFLDVQMPMQSGFEFYQSLEKKPMVIFTTAFSEFATEGFNVNAIDYLLKPFNYERFEVAVSKAFNKHQFLHKIANPKHLFISANYKLYQIEFDKIEHIESFNDYCKIVLHNGKEYVTRMSLKTMFEKLPNNHFFRVHKSFIVPINKIKKISSNSVILDKHEVPLGRSYKKELAKLFYAKK